MKHKSSNNTNTNTLYTLPAASVLRDNVAGGLAADTHFLSFFTVSFLKSNTFNTYVNIVLCNNIHILTLTKMPFVTRNEPNFEGAYVTFRQQRPWQLFQIDNTFRPFPSTNEKWVHTTSCFNGGVVKSTMLMSEGFSSRCDVARMVEQNLGIYSLLDIAGVEARIYRYSLLTTETHNKLKRLLVNMPQDAGTVLMAWVSDNRFRMSTFSKMLDTNDFIRRPPTTDLLEILRIERNTTRPGARGWSSAVPACQDFSTRQDRLDFQATFDVVGRIQAFHDEF